MAALFALIDCNNYNLDSMLSQAVLTVSNAQSKIDVVTSAKVIVPLVDSRQWDCKQRPKLVQYQYPMV
jgi:hypothetical protein